MLDQAEEVFKLADRAESPDRGGLRRLATLLATAVRDGARAHFVLAYREEYHGRFCAWLRDVSADVPDHLPTNLYGNGRFADLDIPAFGRRTPAVEAFRAAIQRPLDAHPGGWHMDPADVERLAEAFARVRAEDRVDDPLVPELQVVLAALIADAEQRGDRHLRVPPDVDALLDDALRAHLERAVRRVAGSLDGSTKVMHARILLGLKRLVTTDGKRRPEGLPRSALLDTLGAQVLDELAGEKVRILVERRGDDAEPVYDLSHDVLAKVVAEAEALGTSAPIDAALLEAERAVAHRAALYAEAKDDAHLALPAAIRQRVRANDWLLWDDGPMAWWAAVVAHHRVRVRNRVLLAATLVALVVGVVWTIAAQRRQAVIDEAFGQLERAEPAVLLEPLKTLLREGAEEARLRAVLRERAPWDAALAAPAGDVEAARAFLIETLLPDADEAGEFGRLVAGVDIARHVDTLGRIDADRHAELRGALHGAIRAWRKAAPAAKTWSPADGAAPDPTTDVHVWVPVPGGTFNMGSTEFPDEQPLHPVKVSAFELGRHPVTRAQYRAFDPKGLESMEAEEPRYANFLATWGRDKVDVDHLPATMVDWYAAQAFAVWLDPQARLPTDAEWEFAARGGAGAPDTKYWFGDDEDDLRKAAWYDATAGGLAHPVCTAPDADFRAHPLGLCDVHGNVWEWAADAYTERYPGEALREDPATLRRGGARVLRGGSFGNSAVYARSAIRDRNAAGARNPGFGFRVARPAPQLGP